MGLLAGKLACTAPCDGCACSARAEPRHPHICNPASPQVAAVAGTKADAAPPARRVPTAEARAWAAARGLQYHEVSSATGAAVAALFAGLFASVLAAAPASPVDAARSGCGTGAGAPGCGAPPQPRPTRERPPNGVLSAP
jgi:hypothetical protein